mmetsp:Transcript_126096/g.315115  ORF Transcript_126096/g.315115 Transcript_126096/m.315115 type:complete len:219 (+) Transcript_126096:1627-2283(+)
MSWKRSLSVLVGIAESISVALPQAMVTFSPCGTAANCCLANVARNMSRSSARTRPWGGNASAMPNAAPPVKHPICKTRVARTVRHKNCSVRTVRGAGPMPPWKRCCVSLLMNFSCQLTACVASANLSQFVLMGLWMLSKYGFIPPHNSIALARCSWHFSDFPALSSVMARSNCARIQSMSENDTGSVNASLQQAGQLSLLLPGISNCEALGQVTEPPA